MNNQNLESSKLISITNDKVLDVVLHCLHSGKLAIVPTDTVYGLIGDAADFDVVGRMYELKGRNFSNKMAVLLPSLDVLNNLVILDDIGRNLVNEFLPGPMTIVARYREANINLDVADKDNYNAQVADILLSKCGNIGVRVPKHDLCQRIAKVFARPIVATSVNLTNHKPAVRIEDIPLKFMLAVDAVVKESLSFSCMMSSTVVDLTNNCAIIREGAIKSSDIIQFMSRHGICSQEQH